MKRTIKLENGKEVKISEESYNELAKALQEPEYEKNESSEPYKTFDFIESFYDEVSIYFDEFKFFLIDENSYGVCTDGSRINEYNLAKFKKAKFEDLKVGDVWAFENASKPEDFKYYICDDDDDGDMRVQQLLSEFGNNFLFSETFGRDLNDDEDVWVLVRD